MKHRRQDEEKILFVDPVPEVFLRIRVLFADDGPEVLWERDIWRLLERFERSAFSVLVLSSASLRLNVDEGIEALEVISAKCPATQVILLVYPQDIKLAAPALRAGTYHYAKFPIGDEELRMLVDTALEKRPTYAPNLLLKDGPEEIAFEDMVGGSEPMHDLYRMIRQAAATDIPVLLLGETGTGKDLAARAIHQLSRRTDGPYTPIHLGAQPDNLVTSELFGHEKGAFTGALERRVGCFEISHQGSVFLDEIATIDEKIQVSLLRLLEDNQIHRIGGNSPVSVDVRVIAASNEDLEQLVRQGRFREDLFFRLEVLSVRVPPLRERHGDLALLVDYFLKRFNDDSNKNILGLAPESVSLLESYHWPGNVRELKNVLYRAVVLCSGEVLLPEHLPDRVQRGSKSRPMISLPVGSTLAEMEREMVARTLVFTGGNRTRAANILGISRRALYNKLERYKIS